MLNVITYTEAKERSLVDGGDCDVLGFPSFCVLFYVPPVLTPGRICQPLQPLVREGCHMLVATKIRANIIFRRLEGNMGKFDGAGSVTTS